MITVGINACIVNEDGGVRKVDGGGVCIVKDSKIISAITEERISLIKYDGGFHRSLPYVLDENELTVDDVDLFVVSFYGVSLEVPQILVDEIKVQLNIKDVNKLMVMPSHHLSHAYAAYFTSEFDSALVVVSDNEGQIIGNKVSSSMFENSCERNSYYLAKGNSITLVDRDFDYPQALGFGKLYNKFTSYLGLGNYHNAGKTMGLASYGSGRLVGIGDAWYEDYDRNLHCIVPDTGNAERDVKALFAKLGVKIPGLRKHNEPMRQIHADIAEYIQKQLEKWSRKKVSYLLDKFQVNSVCISGGIALNCLTNSEISRILGVTGVYVPPAPHDQGQCIGNAIFGILESMRDKPTKVTFEMPLFLGRDYLVDELRIKMVLEQYPSLSYQRLENPDQKAAELLSQGNVIAWYQDRAEFGPRALGNRSILANPSDRLVMNRLNHEVKKRELFRPFAPSVVFERMNDYFFGFNGESPSMMFTAFVRPEMEEYLAAITHIDKTARLQTVTKSSNPKYYNLITHFGNLTGIYVVLNTSFNLDGMPIVDSPEDAVSCFAKSGLDALIIGEFLIQSNSRKIPFQI